MSAKTVGAANISLQSPPSRSWFHQSRLDLLLVLPFVIFFFVQLGHHQMWRDETNPWVLVASSRTLGELFHSARNEAHPFLWYLILWPVSRVTGSLVALKFVAGVVGTCSYLILAFWSPFSRLEKLLLFCCYYISFEYAVIARMYGVMLLLVLLYLRSRVSQPNRLVRNAAWLGLLANADNFGLLLTFALVLEYALFLWGDRSSVKLEWRKQVLPAVAIYIAFVAVSFACLIPTKEVSVRMSAGGPLAHARDRTHLSAAVMTVMLESWYPLDSRAPAHYWNVSYRRRVIDRFLALVLLAAMLQFWRDQRLLFTLLFYGLTLVLFLHLVYLGFSRHYGTMFVAFIALLWIQRSQQAKGFFSPGFGPVPPRFALIPLGVCAWAGIVVAYASWTHPFSQAGATARWLRANHFDRLPLAGTPDYSVANVAEHLGRSMYFLDCSCTDTIMRFSSRRDEFSLEQIPDRLALAFEQTQQPSLIYIGVRPLTPDQVRSLNHLSLQIMPLAQFTGAEENDENFFLYKVKAMTSGG